MNANTPSGPLTIRPMSRRELDLGIEWATSEGWNPGLHDADSFYAAAFFPDERTAFLRHWTTQAGSTALAQSHGMTPVFETARMYTGAAPALPLERLFGVTSFELG